MIGIAIDEGLIPGVDEPMTTWFPEWVGTPREDMTLRDVLTMTSGLDWEESYSPQSAGTSDIIQMVAVQADQLAYAASQPQEVPPGTRFSYSSGDSMLLSGVLEQATGMPADEYAREKIFEPIGMDQAELWTDAVGHGLTYCCVDTTSRGFARFGQLFLQEGRWGDEQVVSAEWVAQSTRAVVDLRRLRLPVVAEQRGGHRPLRGPRSRRAVHLRGAQPRPGGRPQRHLRQGRRPRGGRSEPAHPTCRPRGLVPGKGTVGPSSWNDDDFLGPILASIDDTTPPEVEWFDGTTEAFYEVPDPLPPGAPGDLIRVQAVSANATSTTVRIMYHSRDGLDRDRAVTGMLDLPQRRAAGGRVAGRVARQRHGRPRRALRAQPEGSAVGTAGQAAVGVVTDYIGMGPVGERHPYLSRPARATA